MTPRRRLNDNVLHREGMTCLLGLHGVAFGLFLILPVDTFPSSPSFRVMSQIMPEWTWGVVIAVCGFMTWFSALLDHVWLLRVSAIISMFLWSAIGISFIISNLYSTASVTYPWLALMYMVVFLRSMNEA